MLGASRFSGTGNVPLKRDESHSHHVQSRRSCPTRCKIFSARTARSARRLGMSYEHRPQQMEMATAVAEALRDSQHLMVEAGTGVGKSFGYLLPAIDFAVKNRKKVVISTHTISLQEQLIDKDIPLIQSVYPDEFTAVLVKGRSNYLCQRRLEQDQAAAGHALRKRPATELALGSGRVGRADTGRVACGLSRRARTRRVGTKCAPSTATASARSATSTKTVSGRPPSGA